MTVLNLTRPTTPILAGRTTRQTLSFFSSPRAFPQLIAYDLEYLETDYRTTASDLNGLARSRQVIYRLPATANLTGRLPLFLDEGMQLPLSLTAALQTLAGYKGLAWAEKAGRRQAGAEFFRRYCELLLPNVLRLVCRGKFSFDLACANLIVVLHQGTPNTLQLRKLPSQTNQSSLIDQSKISLVSRITDQIVTSQQFISQLLAQNLRPLIQQLMDCCGVRSEVLWDWAIEIMLNEMAAVTNIHSLETLRYNLLVEELDPGTRLFIRPTGRVLELIEKPDLVYSKRHCCEKFKKDKRCSSCPGRKR